MNNKKKIAIQSHKRASNNLATTGQNISFNNDNQQELESVSLSLGRYGSIRARGKDPVKLIDQTCMKVFGWAIGGLVAVKLVSWGVDKFTQWIDSKCGTKNTSTPTKEPPTDYTPYEDVTGKTEPQPTVKPLTVVLNEDAPKQVNLVGDLITDGDICIIAGAPGQMKSILAMQLAIEISTGLKSKLIPDDEDKESPVKTFYYDGELDDSEIRKRYAGKEDIYLWNITRISDTQEFGSTEKLLDHVESTVMKANHPSCVVFDNMYCLFEGLNAGKAVEILKRIKSIKNKAQNPTTFIIVAHPTKEYDPQHPMELKHIAGSSNFTNLATTVIGICPSRLGDEYKVLQVLKKRSGSKYKGKILLEKLGEEDYLHLEYVDAKDEQGFNQWATFSDPKSAPDANAKGITHDMKVQMADMNMQGSSYDKIVDHFKKQGITVSRSSVGNYINEIKVERNGNQP